MEQVLDAIAWMGEGGAVYFNALNHDEDLAVFDAGIALCAVVFAAKWPEISEVCSMQPCR